jgi:hypothetical protein
MCVHISPLQNNPMLCDYHLLLWYYQHPFIPFIVRLARASGIVRNALVAHANVLDNGLLLELPYAPVVPKRVRIIINKGFR